MNSIKTVAKFRKTKTKCDACAELLFCFFAVLVVVAVVVAYISYCLHDVDCFRKYRSQNATNVFAELDEEAVTGVDCDGVVFDPSNFKAVREVSLYRHLVFLYD